jgi:hypothetical protein
MKRFPLILLCLTAAALAVIGRDTKPAAKLPTAGERFGNLQNADAPSYRRHVVPLLSRTGCSGRECHGAFAGQGGFQLSLFGYDFDTDHKEITQDSDGGEAEVRVNLKQPAESLLIKKGAALIKHKGKERFAKDSWEYNLLLKWVASGAKNDTAETGEFDRLEVLPKEIVFKRAGEKIQLTVLAHWKDGTVEDVTQLTRFRSNDEAVADVSATGQVECKERGDTHVIAFYDNGVHPIPVMLPVSDLVGSKYPKVATPTKVDELIVAKLRKLGMVPSGKCTDTEFLRRVSIDITGTLPTPAEVEAFAADKSPDKRAKKINQLLDTPAYAAWWTTLLCDFTGNNSRQLNNGGNIRGINDQMSRQWYDWIYARVVRNEPYDKLAAGIVLAKSRTSPEQSYKDYALEMSSYFKKDHPADFTQRESLPQFWARRNVQKPEEKALAFAHTFLGVRIECAQCHKHPFDQWTKTDFAQFQAFFEPIRYGSSPTKNEEVTAAKLQKEIQESLGVKDKKNAQRELQNAIAKRIAAGELAPWPELYITASAPKKPTNKDKKSTVSGGRVITPKILGGEEVMLTQYPDPREPLMEWLRHKDNPYFARAWVNRVWAVYFGRGLVEPADDLNLANPPTNGEVMDYLARGFVESGYDMKWLHREIATSDAYQRSWQPTPSNKLDEKNFSRALIRRLPAEVVIDGIRMASASQAQQKDFVTLKVGRAIGPEGAGGSGRGGNAQYSLSIFGKPAREANCDCERTADPTLLQTIYTRNDPELLQMLESSNRGNPTWITELRQQYSANGKYGSTEAQLAALEARAAKIKKPQAPEANASDDKKRRYESDLKRYDKEMAELANRRADLKQLLAAQKAAKPFNAPALVREVFLRTVNRPPTAEEVKKAEADIAAAKDPVDGVRDLLWAMVNTREFMVNH